MKKIRISLIVLVVMCLICIIGAIAPKKEYGYPVEILFESNMGYSQASVVDSIHLPIGVYDVQILYSSSEDYTAFFSIKDGTVFNGGLLCNGEHTYKNLDSTSFNMWLFENTENLEVRCEYFSNGDLLISGILIKQTYKLYTMLIGMFIFIEILFTVVVLFREKWRPQMNKEQKAALYFCMIIVLFSSFFALYGDQLSNIDTSFHYHRIEGMANGILSGQIPVRIEPDWLYGQGFACAIYYCDIFLLLPAIMRIMGFTVSFSYNVFQTVANAATVAIAYHCFKRIFSDYRIAIVTTAMYTLSTYRIYKFFITGDVGEGTAFIFFPLIACGFYLLFSVGEDYKNAWVYLVTGYAGIIQSHALTCLMGAVLSVILCILCVNKVFKKHIIMELFKSAIIAFALSAWYLVPFIDYYLTQDMHINNIVGRLIQNRGVTIAQLFMNYWHNGSETPLGNNGMQNTYPVGLGFVLGICIIILIVELFLVRDRKRVREYKAAVICLFLAILQIILSLNVFPWDYLQTHVRVLSNIISSIEFQTRMLEYGTLFAVLCGGFGLKLMLERSSNRLFRWNILVLSICITTSTVFLQDDVNKTAGRYNIYNIESMGFGFVSDSEFVREGVNADILSFETYCAGTGMEVSEYNNKNLHVNAVVNNTTDQPCYLDLPLLNYRGYKAWIVGENGKEELAVSDNEKLQVRVSVPALTSGKLSVGFFSPWYWRVSEAVSFIAVIGMLIVGICYYAKKENSITA